MGQHWKISTVSKVYHPRFPAIIAVVLLSFAALLILSHGPVHLYSLNLPPVRSFNEALHLNLKQDDPRLVEFVRTSDNFIEPGSSEDYALTFPQEFLDPSEAKVGPLLDYIFDYKNAGSFLEAGAFDGELHSTTIYVERFRKWRGLLVEASPKYMEHLRKKHRKSSLVGACLSIEPRPMQVDFLETGSMTGRIANTNEYLDGMVYYACKYKGMVQMRKNYTHYKRDWLKRNECHLQNQTVPTIKVNCLPVYTLLLATGYTKLDFLSLDVEGAELKILKTIPFDKVDIQVIRVEVAVLKKEEVKEVKELLEAAGYTRILLLEDYEFPEEDDELFYWKKPLLAWLFGP